MSKRGFLAWLLGSFIGLLIILLLRCWGVL